MTACTAKLFYGLDKPHTCTLPAGHAGFHTFKSLIGDISWTGPDAGPKPDQRRAAVRYGNVHGDELYVLATILHSDGERVTYMADGYEASNTAPVKDVHPLAGTTPTEASSQRRVIPALSDDEIGAIFDAANVAVTDRGGSLFYAWNEFPPRDDGGAPMMREIVRRIVREVERRCAKPTGRGDGSNV